MILNDNEAKSLKGYILSELLISKRTYIICTIIIFTIIILSELIELPMSLIGHGSSNSGGALISGFCVAYFSMLISSIKLSHNKALTSKFVFPINRKIYTIGNFIIFCLSTFILLLITCNAYFLEILTSIILKSIFKNFVYINNITFESYSFGFIISLLYIVTLTCLTYFLFMIFFKFKIKGISSISVLILTLLMFPFGRNLLFGTLMFFIREQSVIILALKLSISAIIFQLLSYIPLKNMEVNY